MFFQFHLRGHNILVGLNLRLLGLFTFDLGNNLIGAGASSPLTKFQVSAAGTKNVPTLGSAASAPLLITNNDPTYGLVIGTNATDGRVWIQSQRTDATATAYNITLNEAGGNVGVGTTTPAATFDVVGTFSVARASVLNQCFTQTTTTWNIRSLPTVLIIKDTMEIGRAVGVKTKDEIRALYNR